VVTNGENGRTFLFTDQDFQRVRKLLYDHTGISLSEAKRDLVYSRLGGRLRSKGLTSFHDYLAYLESHKDEWETFINSLTTNLTSFFREAHHFDILAEHVKKVMHRKPIELWCSAASTGEEPYSMAMTMVDLFGSYRPPVHILATDIDTAAIKKAKEGIFSIDRLEKLPTETVSRFFLTGNDSPEGLIRVRQELREMITFRQLNLLDASWPCQGPFEAIFCRNVMIYFDKQTQYNILKKFVPFMRRDALLFAGHSESSYHAEDLFKTQGKTVYNIADKSKPMAHP